MELRGAVRLDLPLLVVALQEEAEGLDDDLPVLITGPGKVNAAVAVTSVLASSRPAAVINLGTAGGLHDGLRGVHEVHTVMQHDFDNAIFRDLVDRDYGLPIRLDSDDETARLILATGDHFVADRNVRSSLARDAHLVDMEGYAVAWAARAAEVSGRLIKLVSDDASEGAGRTWAETVGEHSRELSRWVREELLR